MRSWDSHAHYQDYPDEEDGDEGGLGGGNGNEDGQDNPEGGLYPSSIRPIVCYCDMSTFKTPRTILRVLLVVRRKLFFYISELFYFKLTRRPVASGGAAPPQFLAKQLTLSQPGGQIMPTTVIQAPPDFQTLRRPCIGRAVK